MDAEVRQALIWWCTAGEFYFGFARQAYPKSLGLFAASHHKTLTLFVALPLNALGYFLVQLGYFSSPALLLFRRALLLFRSGLTLFGLDLTLFPDDK